MKCVVDKELDIFIFCFFPSVQRRMGRASDCSLRLAETMLINPQNPAKDKYISQENATQ